MRGKVRNWAYLVRGKPSFTRKMQPDPDSTGSRFGKAGSTTGAVAGSLIAPAPEAAPPTARPEPAPAPTAQLGARAQPVDFEEAATPVGPRTPPETETAAPAVPEAPGGPTAGVPVPLPEAQTRKAIRADLRQRIIEEQ